MVWAIPYIPLFSSYFVSFRYRESLLSFLHFKVAIFSRVCMRKISVLAIVVPGRVPGHKNSHSSATEHAIRSNLLERCKKCSYANCFHDICQIFAYTVTNETINAAINLTLKCSLVFYIRPCIYTL